MLESQSEIKYSKPYFFRGKSTTLIRTACVSPACKNKAGNYFERIIPNSRWVEISIKGGQACQRPTRTSLSDPMTKPICKVEGWLNQLFPGMPTFRVWNPNIFKHLLKPTIFIENRFNVRSLKNDFLVTYKYGTFELNKQIFS